MPTARYFRGNASPSALRAFTPREGVAIERLRVYFEGMGKASPAPATPPLPSLGLGKPLRDQRKSGYILPLLRCAEQRLALLLKPVEAFVQDGFGFFQIRGPNRLGLREFIVLRTDKAERGFVTENALGIRQKFVQIL